MTRTACAMLTSCVMFPSSPLCREMTSAGVHFSGVMPRILKSSGRSFGLRLASSTAALIPSTKAVTIASPWG